MVVEERHDTVPDGPAEVKVQTLGQKKKNWPSWMQGVGRYTGRQKSRDEDADSWRETG